MEDVYTIKSSAFPKTTRVLSFRGTEAISAPYRFELYLSVPVDDARELKMNDIVGKTASLAMHGDREDAFTFHGILTGVKLAHAHATYALFTALLEPRFARLGLTQHSRLFTEKSVPDVIKAVLEENGLKGDDVAIKLSGSYAVEEHVCQYRESDLNFVSRWMEHLGIYYFFEHGDEKEQLVITDAKSSQSDWPSAAVRYVPLLEGDAMRGNAIETFSCNATDLPTTVRLKDYDHTKPTLDVSASAKVAQNGFGEVCVYGARFFTPDDGKKLADVRAEELLARQLEHEACGTVPLRAGFQFSLEEHPMDMFNAKYLATRVEHFGNSVGSSPDLAKRIPIKFRDVYRCEARAIPEKLQFRPERKAPWPRINGFEHGVICGEQDSEYAQIDDHGRYRVKLAFDESTLKDGKASTWVRMMQPHGGSVEGFHFPLRKGTEVVLAFLAGDADRPVIAGVVNNAHTPSPVTSGNNTTNVIQTGGRNRIELEDKAGQQRITISSPTMNSYVRMGAPNDDDNLIIKTDGNSLVHAGQNMEFKVDIDMKETIGGNLIEDYKGTQETTVKSGRTDTILGGGEHKTTTGDSDETITGAFTHVVSGDVLEHYGTQSTEIDGIHQFKSATCVRIADDVTDEYATLTQKIAGPLKVSAGPSWFKLGPCDFKVDSHMAVTFGVQSDTFIGLKNSNALAGTLDLFVGIKLAASMALTASFNMGVALEANASVKLALEPTGIKNKTMELVFGALELSSKATKLYNSGALVIT